MADQLLQSNITILIIEDSESDRVTYSRYLQSDLERTYRIIEAETLGEGLELWRSQRPDIVLIDLNLPDGNGLEFLEAINDNAGEKVPVIVLTGQGNEKMAVRAMKLGAADYLVKGDINAKLLTIEVKKVLQETVFSKQLQRSQQQQALISAITLRIREFTDLDDISNAIVKEVRQFINTDRAIIYQFNPDMSGTVIAEDIASPWRTCLNEKFEDTCFRDNLGGAYCEGRSYVVNDVYAANLTACHLHLLERFQVRANLAVPILLPNENKHTLWGLLILHQCSAPRIWEEADIQLLQRLSVKLSIAIKQAIAYQKVENELADRKRAEQELLKLNQSLEAKVKERTQEFWQVNQLLQTVLDSFPLSVFWKDRQSVCLGCNQLFAMTNGMKSPLEVIGKSTLDFSYTENEVLAYLADDQQVMESGVAKLNIEETVTLASGEQQWLQTNKIPLRDSKGNVIGVMGTFQDISDRKQAELQLQQTTDRLALALNSGAIACWEWDIVNNTIIWDERAYELHGIPLGTSVSFDTWANSIHPEDLQFTQTLSEQAVVGEGEFDAEYRVIHPDQSIHFLKGYGLVVRDIDGSPQKMIGVNFDISARKQAELQLQKTSDRLALALSSGAIGYWEWDIQQNSLAWDAQMYKLYGGAATTNSRMAYETWANTIHPDDHKATETLLQEAVLGLTDYDCEFRVIHPVHSIHFIKAYGKIEKNAQGKAQSMIGVNFDISDRKQSESQLKLANQELLRATKLKDEFLATMSHELRTPLNSILGLSESLKDEILGSINDKQLKALSIVESSGEHLLSLINDILDLSKISAGMMELDIESVSVKNLCSSSLVFVKQQAFNKRIQIHSNIPAHINNINIDERRIKQVLINLLTNAIKFTPKEGKVNLLVAIGSGDTWQGEAKIPQRIKTINSPTILFQVVDTGIGINSRDLKILFQPFVQVDSALNRQYEGTGLGLALVKQIVELHGGQVIAESEVGQGSRFTVALPCEMSEFNAIASTPTSTTSSSPDIIPDNAPLILLAEDNEANIQTFSSYLTAINYRVIIARNGIEAIAQAKENLPDIILMDIQMPIMDGLEATKQIRLDPNLGSVSHLLTGSE